MQLAVPKHDALVIILNKSDPCFIDLELTIDPALPPRWNFRDYDFLIPYGM